MPRSPAGPRRVAERRRDEVGRRVRRLDHGDVVLRLAGHDLRARLRPVGEGQLDVGRAGDDVERGQDVAGRVDDDAAAEPAAGPVFPLAFGAVVSMRTTDGSTAWKTACE